MNTIQCWCSALAAILAWGPLSCFQSEVRAQGLLAINSPQSVPIDWAPLDPLEVESSIFQDILNADDVTAPILVRHRQDPNALRPGESLQTAPQSPSAGSQVARNLLGQPRSQMYASRSRLRTVAMSQNRAAPMIGDFFGGGTTSLTMNPVVGIGIPRISQAGLSEGDGFQVDSPNGVFFFAGKPISVGSFTPLRAFGVDLNNDMIPDFFPGLEKHQILLANGTIDPNVVPGGEQFAANATDTLITVGNSQLPIVTVNQVVNLVDVPNPGSGGVVGTVKIAENTSPMPRDRVYFNYSHFDGVPLTRNGMSINRFTPGFEKTFNEGTSSVEFRAPFATTLNSNVSTSGISDGEQLEFGNVSISLKSLVYRDDSLAVSVGIQNTLPTSDAVNVTTADGTTIFKVKNQSVHLMPFVGALYTPDERFFAQAFWQLDVATNGNNVLANLDFTKLRQIGTLNDATYMYFDWSVGYWAYLNEDSAGLTGIAPMLELHHNQSLQGTDVVQGPNNFRFGSFASNTAVTNAVIGTTFQFGPSTTVTAGYATPLGGGNDQQFNGEFRLFFNRRFGPQSVQTRAF